jgi:Na+/H+ antiporter NhaD/arsenite permease-like protein
MERTATVAEVRADARDPDVPEPRGRGRLYVFLAAALAVVVLGALGHRDAEGLWLPALLPDGDPVPFAFALFVLVLLGVALFHHHTLWVALAGVVAITAYTLAFVEGYPMGAHFLEEADHTLLNLGGLLLGFAILAKFFEQSGVPEILPRLLPRRPLLGAFTLLAVVWVISSFLDNIAAAMIGGVMARAAFRGRVTIAYVAAIVAASNAGGAWSVLGDTTTTMMWIEGKSPLEVARALLPSAVALLVFGFLSSARQNRVQRIDVGTAGGRRAPVDGLRLAIVGLILAGAIATNFALDRPFVGVWAAILLGALLRRPAWEELPGAAKGALFLLSLVWCASLMPVGSLPPASWETTFGMGFVSSVFDNIPLTKLALEQGGYDWGMLAFAVGFGGSMIWFGSSAGVAISKDFPEARRTGRYVAEGWPIALAYVVAFFAMLATLGWK